VGASGSVSGIIVALSVLRPNSAVAVIGDVNASNPLMLQRFWALYWLT
jgi:membrane associated rhomboid family serine protease